MLRTVLERAREASVEVRRRFPLLGEKLTILRWAMRLEVLGWRLRRVRAGLGPAEWEPTSPWAIQIVEGEVGGHRLPCEIIEGRRVQLGDD